MSIHIIESHFTLPLKKQGLEKGPNKDYTISIKIGGGDKRAIVKFQNPKHRDLMNDELTRIAEQNGIKLTLDIAA